MKTKIFCDIADYKTIKFFNNKNIVDGFTTNPSLMRLAGAKSYKEYSKKIEFNEEIVKQYFNKDINLMSKNFDNSLLKDPYFLN